VDVGGAFPTAGEGSMRLDEFEIQASDPGSLM
jgi:hypothetical protein